MGSNYSGAVVGQGYTIYWIHCRHASLPLPEKVRIVLSMLCSLNAKDFLISNISFFNIKYAIKLKSSIALNLSTEK